MKIVKGEGPVPCRWLFLAEAPAWQEVKYGRPLVGDTGKEFDAYLRRHGIKRNELRIENTVPYRIEDRDKASPEKRAKLIRDNEAHLRHVFETVKPEVVFAAGSLACQVFKSDTDMEMEHGIPYYYGNKFGKFVVMPCYHPAAGLHQTRRMTQIEQDFWSMANLIITSSYPVQHTHAPHKPDGKYWEITNPTELLEYLIGIDIVSCDFESVVGNPYTIQLSGNHKTAVLIDATSESLLEILREELPSRLVIFHNAEFDLPLLWQLSIDVQHYDDTMKLAYLLGDEPQSLKRLVYRHFHTRMVSYNELVSPYNYDHAKAYLEQIVSREWNDPEAEMVWDLKKEEWRVKQPQNIVTKVKRLLKSCNANTDLHAKWKAMDYTEQIEEVLGEMPEASVADVPRQDLIKYGCADADYTLRLYPLLLERWGERSN